MMMRRITPEISSMRRIGRSVLTLVIFLFLFFPISGKGEATASPRPRIGLVLSGGGARGIAHIGVLKVLEEMRIPVDVIAGTSMGSIVGGLYAAGLSPAELEKLVTSVEWNKAFRDKPPPEEQPFRRKQDTQQYQIDFDLGFKNGQFTIPLGFVQGQGLNYILNMALIHEAEVKDFDRLHIPFRAVAANIETGEAVVIGKGNLATALRASMSIPTVFTPVEMEGKMLVDGGIANNLPMDVARQMGADVLICVDIGTPLLSREKLESAASITVQVTTILVQRNVAFQLETLRPGDILIKPDLGDAGTTDFTKASEILKIGEAKARTMKSQLARLSRSDVEYSAYLRRQRHEPKEMPTIDDVQIVNDSRLSDTVLAAQVETKPGEILDDRRLYQDLVRLYNLGIFERVDMHLENEKGRTGLTFTPVNKLWGQTNIRFGFSFDDNFRGSSTYSISAIINQMELNSMGAEWRNHFQIGDMPRIYSEFYQPLDASTRFFIAPLIEYRERNINLFDDSGNNVVQYRVKNLQAGLDVGRQFGDWGEFRIGFRRGYGAYRVNIGDPSLDSGSFNRGGIYTALSYNTLDNFNFPLRGTVANISWLANVRQLGSDVSNSGLVMGWTRAMTWGDNTLLPGFIVQTMLNGDGLMEDSFNIGGFLNLSGYTAGELSGQHTALGRLVYLRRISRLGLGNLKMQMFVGGSAEAGHAWNRREDISFSTLTAAGSVFIGADSFLGPAYIGYGQAEGGHSMVYFSIGQKF
jgi:NTE family protein